MRDTEYAIRDALGEKPRINLNRTDKETQMLQALKKTPKILGYLKESHLPLPQSIINDFAKGEWIWMVEPIKEGPYKGWYSGAWIVNDLDNKEILPMVFVEPEVYLQVILKK